MRLLQAIRPAVSTWNDRIWNYVLQPIRIHCHPFAINTAYQQMEYSATYVVREISVPEALESVGMVSSICHICVPTLI